MHTGGGQKININVNSTESNSKINNKYLASIDSVINNNAEYFYSAKILRKPQLSGASKHGNFAK